MDLATIKELEEWMDANCYGGSYAIGSRNITEGCGLDTFGSLYVWYFTERGQRENLHYFWDEKEAVEFAFKEITSDPHANRHLVGFLKDKNLMSELLRELESRNIKYSADEIPFDRISYRVFVFGCDILDALDLKWKYCPV